MNENALLIIIGFFLVIYFPGLIAIGILGFFIYALFSCVGLDIIVALICIVCLCLLFTGRL
jgi:hypothetical protein